MGRCGNQRANSVVSGFLFFFYLPCSFGLANDSLVTFSGSLVSLYVPVQGSFLGSLGVFSAIL